jgi:hypothetical protein
MWGSPITLKFYDNVRPLTFNLTSVMLGPGNGNCNVTCRGMILLTVHGSNISSQIPDFFAEPSD